MPSQNVVCQRKALYTLLYESIYKGDMTIINIHTYTKSKLVIRVKDKPYIVLKGSIHLGSMTIINTYTPNNVDPSI
jgi:hypothetical protein